MKPENTSASNSIYYIIPAGFWINIVQHNEEA